MTRTVAGPLAALLLLTLMALSAAAPATATEVGMEVRQLEQIEPADQDEVSSQLDEILADPAFESVRPPNAWERFVSWVSDRIGRFLARLLGGALELGGWPVVGALIVAGTAAVLGLVGGRRRAARRTVEAASGIFGETGTDLDQLRRRAAEAQSAGDHAGFVRFRFLAGLVELARQGRLALSPSLTTAMAAKQVPDQRFGRLVATFDAVVYGGRPVTARDAEHADATWDAVLDAVEATP